MEDNVQASISMIVSWCDTSHGEEHELNQIFSENNGSQQLVDLLLTSYSQTNVAILHLDSYGVCL